MCLVIAIPVIPLRVLNTVLDSVTAILATVLANGRQHIFVRFQFLNCVLHVLLATSPSSCKHIVVSIHIVILARLDEFRLPDLGGQANVNVAVKRKFSLFTL